MILGLEDTFTVGEDAFFASDSHKLPFSVTFEDDLRTGYFYAFETESNPTILDALHIYDAANVSDKQKPCKIQIAWSDDGAVASLLINNYCHAIFDFDAKAGYCRNGFPESNRDWVKVKERLLTDELITEIFSSRT